MQGHSALASDGSLHIPVQRVMGGMSLTGNANEMRVPSVIHFLTSCFRPLQTYAITFCEVWREFNVHIAPSERRATWLAIFE